MSGGRRRAQFNFAGCSAAGVAALAALHRDDREARGEQQQADPELQRRSKPVNGSVLAFAALVVVVGVVSFDGEVSLPAVVVGVVDSFDGDVPVAGVVVVGVVAGVVRSTSGSSPASCSRMSVLQRRSPRPAATSASASSSTTGTSTSRRAVAVRSFPRRSCTCCPWPARGHDIGPSHANLPLVVL